MLKKRRENKQILHAGARTRVRTGMGRGHQSMKVPPQGCQSHGSPPGKSSHHLIIIHRLRSILQEINKNQSSTAELEIKDFPNWGLEPRFFYLAGGGWS